MKRWDTSERGYVERPEVDAFLADVVAVYKKHGLVIEHEDTQGAFVVRPFNDGSVEWLMSAIADDRGQK